MAYSPEGGYEEKQNADEPDYEIGVVDIVAHSKPLE